MKTTETTKTPPAVFWTRVWLVLIAIYSILKICLMETLAPWYESKGLFVLKATVIILLAVSALVGLIKKRSWGYKAAIVVMSIVALSAAYGAFALLGTTWIHVVSVAANAFGAIVSGLLILLLLRSKGRDFIERDAERIKIDCAEPQSHRVVEQARGSTITRR